MRGLQEGRVSLLQPVFFTHDRAESASASRFLLFEMFAMIDKMLNTKAHAERQALLRLLRTLSLKSRDRSFCAAARAMAGLDIPTSYLSCLEADHK